MDGWHQSRDKLQLALVASGMRTDWYIRFSIAGVSLFITYCALYQSDVGHHLDYFSGGFTHCRCIVEISSLHVAMDYEQFRCGLFHRILFDRMLDRIRKILHEHQYHIGYE